MGTGELVGVKLDIQNVKCLAIYNRRKVLKYHTLELCEYGDKTEQVIFESNELTRHPLPSHA